MGRRLLPALLAGLAALSDAQGSHRLAYDVLLAAVPVTAVAALAALGDCLARDDVPARRQALLSCAALALLVLSCAVRSTALHGVPPLAVSALVAAVGLFGVKALLVALPFVRNLVDVRPAKP